MGWILNIGSLNKRIELQAQTKTSDEMGGFVTIWTSMLPAGTTIAAAIWPISASEMIQAGQTVMTITHRIRIRYRSVLKNSWKIKFGNRYFAIVSILNPNEAGKYLDILCKEAA